jgi:alpha/beta superfamily hydrolase
MTIGPASRPLRACLETPPGTPRAGVVVCHPHPQYGGDMENAVVVAVARVLVVAGVVALRFDFGPWSGGAEEVDDARVALATLAERLPAGTPLALAGYSFGAWVALRVAASGARVGAVAAIAPPLAFFEWTFLDAVAVPVRFVLGDRDQYCPLDRLEDVVRRSGGRFTLDVVPGADHFLAGHDADVGRRVAAAVVRA